MKIYICGPTNKELRVTLETFEHWEKKIKEHLPDVTVINPTSIDTGLPWGDYMKERIRALLECKVVLCLQYWSQSTVASAEFVAAVEKRLPLFFEADFQQMVEYCKLQREAIYRQHLCLSRN